jgi:hypothetical protein
MKRLPILICVILVAASVLWMSGNPSGGQTGTDFSATDSEGSFQPHSSERVAPENIRLAQYDSAETEKQNSKKPKKDPKANSADAKAYFQQARRKFLSYKTIRASLEEQVVIGGRSFKADGSYVQDSSTQGNDLKLRLEFRISLGATENESLQGELEQVSDGENLWTRHKIGKNTRVSRRNIRQILDAGKARGNIPMNILVAQLGLGGFPALLASIERDMKFISITEEELSGKSFTVISATWSEEYLKRFAGLTREANSKRLPDYIPDSMQIYFEKGNQFPRRILYLKKHSTRDISLPMVDLQFRQVELNKPVDDEVFVFKAPKDVFQNDLTGVYLQLFQQSPQSGVPTSRP